MHAYPTYLKKGIEKGYKNENSAYPWVVELQGI